MKKFLFFVCLSFSVIGQKLSPDAQFGLVTIETGAPKDEIYQVFGHAVFHLSDPKNGIDECYDYGTFDFNTDGFVVKFLKGTLPYMMAINDFKSLIYYYQNQEKRTAQEQILNLSQNQKQALFDFLKTNYLPINREYHYRFFYYNCSSRLRDIIGKVCKDSLRFSTKLHADSSYRQWIAKYSHQKMPWYDFGMSLAIGLPADKKTGADGAMFLPNNLMMAFDSAKIFKNGQWQALVSSKKTLTFVNQPNSQNGTAFTPLLVFNLLLIFTTFYTAYQLKIRSNRLLFDKLLFGIVGLMGCFIIGLWFFTDHGVTENNLNIFWACPIFLPIVFYLNVKSNFIRYFFLFYALVQISILICWKIMPQEFHIAQIPIFLILIQRSIRIWWMETLKQKIN